MLRLNGYWNLIAYRVFADLASEARRYYVSYLWWVLEPVLNMGVLYLVFGIFLNRGTANYVQFLLVGVSVWKWFNSTVQNGSGSIVNSRGVVLQAYLPKTFFPMVVGLTDTFKFLIVLCILLVFLWITGFPPTKVYLALPLLIAAQFWLNYGLTCILAAILPFFLDLRFLIATALQLGFFVSGIFFEPKQILLPKHVAYFYLNPMASLVEAYRAVLIQGAWPDPDRLLYVCGLSLVLVIAGTRLLHHFDKTYPKVI